MPLLDLECPEHGQQEVYVRRAGSEHPCPQCGKTSRRLWSNPAAYTVEFRAGYDRMLWQHFDTKRQRDEYLRKENLTKVG